jgi:YD repeat-containing protein
MLCLSLQFRHVSAALRPWLLAVMLATMVLPALARAADVETRDLRIFVDNKNAGDAHMTFNRADDGTLTLSCDTDVFVRILFITYKYKYRGREVWKDGRLQSFDSTCNDDGKLFDVAAAAKGDKLRVRVKTGAGQEEREVPGDVWLSSYWKQPDPKVVNKTIPIIDADSGSDINAKVVYVGAEQRNVAGQVQPVQHYRLEGKNNIELWYDAAGRLVRQDWMEQNHRTVLELVRIRR